MVLRLFLLTISLNILLVSGDGPRVKIKNGLIEGVSMKTKNGRDFSAYLGIPFAKPPLGELRFEAPVEAEPWEGVLDATRVHTICPQRDIYRRSEEFEGDEDCLYLNVYSPHKNGTAKELLPVMLFFHGGGWLCGGGNSMWYGPQRLLDRDIILVVTNYRLGPLGFLSTGDSVVPGNNGLKDQNLAIRWIKENIDQFGGDPDKITLFGESAGGASTHLHMVSPMSRDLIKGGIAQSGTSFCVWALAPKNEAVTNAKKLAESLNCPTDSSKKMVACLKKLDAFDIIKKDTIFMEWDFDPMIPFKPVIEPKVEGAFLTEHPLDIIKAGKSARIPLIVGLNTEDGALRAAGIFGNPHLIDELNSDFNRLVPISLMYGKTAPNPQEVTKRIKHFYFHDRKIRNSSRDDLVHMYTDGWFLNCADEAVRAHRKYVKAPVYYYLFGHRGVASFTEIFGDKHNDYGVCHADDLQYLFPIADGLFPDRTHSEDDLKVVEMMTKLWSNFASNGNPTPEPDDVIPEAWKPVESDDMEYYFIDPKEAGMKEGLLIERAKFWRSLNWNSKGPKQPKDEL